MERSEYRVRNQFCCQAIISINWFKKRKRKRQQAKKRTQRDAYLCERVVRNECTHGKYEIKNHHVMWQYCFIIILSVYIGLSNNLTMCDKIIHVLVIINYKMVLSVFVCVTWQWFYFIDSEGKHRFNRLWSIFNVCSQYNLIAFQYIESMGKPTKIFNEIFIHHMSDPIEYTVCVNQNVHRLKLSCTTDWWPIFIVNCIQSICNFHMHACHSNSLAACFLFRIFMLINSHRFDKYEIVLFKSCFHPQTLVYASKIC